MLLRRVGVVGVPSITADQAKARLRVTQDAEDDVITSMIASACDTVREMSGRSLAFETWELSMPEMTGAVRLPKSPVIALVSVKYLDGDEVLQTQDVSDFALITSDDWSYVQPKVGKVWPTSPVDRDDAVRMQFTAGYDVLPPNLLEAIMLLVGHRFRNREAVSETPLTEVPMSARDLIGLHQLSWYGQ